MASFVLSSIGATLGASFGSAGAVAGMLIGTTIGRVIDNNIFSTSRKINISGNQITDIPIQNSAYGVAINKLYGELRVSGNVIWADKIKEHAHHHARKIKGRKGMGKTTVSSTTYTYTISLAIAICAGPIDCLLNIWADSKILTQGNYNLRLYTGNEEQMPDPLIEAHQGAGKTPAYRGLAYIVIENFPLGDYGNRIPNFSFQIRKQAKSIEQNVEQLIESICIIPGSGEFVYDPKRQYLSNISYTYNNQLIQIGKNQVINENNYQQKTDAELSTQQLLNTCSNLKWVSPVVVWFADNLDASKCNILPAVENKSRHTYPDTWQVAHYSRGNAKQITIQDGRPIYGGTISDNSLLRYLEYLKKQQLKIMLNPMLFIDRDDKPWRGFLTCSEFEIYNFFHKTYGYNNFIIHYAKLVKGKIDAFIIGSELRGLTTIQDAKNQFPAVKELISLAKKVKEILGPETLVIYAADWTEYHHTVGGWYHLDELWASSYIDRIGIDAYFPLSNDHKSPSLQELKESWFKGEGYEYFYTDRAKTTKLSLDPEYAWKNLEWWWKNSHINPDGTKSKWQARSKKIWFTEYGFPSVDCASNEPNIFYDPESSSGGIPVKSKGRIDFLAQRTAIKATELAWRDSKFVEQKFLWTWDARPYPYWPRFSNIWSDAYKWSRGHWVNGKFGLTELSSLIMELCLEAGIPAENVIIEGLNEIIDGYLINNSKTVLEALEELQSAYFFDIIEIGNKLKFLRNNSQKAFIPIDKNEIIFEENLINIERQCSTIKLSSLKVVYLDKDREFQSSVYNQIDSTAANNNNEKILKINLVCKQSSAAKIAMFNILKYNNDRNIYNFRVSSKYFYLEPSDLIIIKLNNVFYRLKINKIFINKDLTISITASKYLSYECDVIEDADFQPKDENIPIAPDYGHQIIDIPAEAASEFPSNQIRFALWSKNKNFKPASLYVTSEVGEYQFIENIYQEAVIGHIMNDLPASQIGIIDRKNKIRLSIINGQLESIDYQQLLAGKNRAFINGEIIQFMNAKLIGSNLYLVSNIVRGQNYTENRVKTHKSGSRFILLDSAISQIELPDYLLNQQINYKIAADNQALDELSEYSYYHLGNSTKEISPINLEVNKISKDLYQISWINRQLNYDFWQENLLSKELKSSALLEIYKNNKKIISEVVNDNKYHLKFDKFSNYKIRLYSLSVKGKRGLSASVNFNNY